MSVQAMAWAMGYAPVDDPTEALLLVALGNNADDKGRGAYPSQATLAKVCRVTDRSIRRILSGLEARGLIRRGDQRMVLHYPEHLRPVVWDLALELRRPQAEDAGDRGSPPDAGDLPTAQAEDAHVRKPRTPTSDNPSIHPSFNTWWNAYPRKVGKPAAQRAYTAALKKTDPDKLLAALAAYPFSDDIQYVPHPATWLNQERWADVQQQPAERVTHYTAETWQQRRKARWEAAQRRMAELDGAAQ